MSKLASQNIYKIINRFFTPKIIIGGISAFFVGLYIWILTNRIDEAKKDLAQCQIEIGILTNEKTVLISEIKEQSNKIELWKKKQKERELNANIRALRMLNQQPGNSDKSGFKSMNDFLRSMQ